LPEQDSLMKSIDSNFKTFCRCDNRIALEPETISSSTGFGNVSLLWKEKKLRLSH